MNWADYIVLAEGLVGERHDASKRTAVSRAYYGALNLSRHWLEENVAPINKHRVHAEVWRAFRAAGGSASTRVGGEWELVADLGDALRALRNRADYDDSFPDLDQQAAEAVRAAKEVLALLARLEPAE